MKFAWIITLLWLGICLPALAAYHAEPDDYRINNNLVDGPKSRGDSGVTYVPYLDMEMALSGLAAKYPGEAKLIQYGKTVDGRNLNLLRIEGKAAPAKSNADRPAVEISGAIHGNEYLGIEDKLAAYFLEHQSSMPGLSSFLALGGVIYVIPVVNPDGYEARARGNSHDVDLNRDFDVLPTHQKKLTEPETASLAQYIDGDLKTNHLQLKLSLDYHCCVPAFITPWTYVDELPRPEDKATFARIGKLQTATLGYDIGNAAATVGYLAVGTTVDYFYAKYGTTALTIEGKYGGEASALDKHVQLWDGIFKDIAARH